MRLFDWNTLFSYENTQVSLINVKFQSPQLFFVITIMRAVFVRRDISINGSMKDLN